MFAEESLPFWNGQTGRARRDPLLPIEVDSATAHCLLTAFQPVFLYLHRQWFNNEFARPTSQECDDAGV